MALSGVRVGPLDPDATAEFGQVAAKTSARQLVRYHVALNPPELIGALTRARNDARSTALDLDELKSAVEDAWGDDAPEGFELNGASVRGHEDAEKVATFTWYVPVEAGGSGRTGKGFVAYDEDTLPNSVANGDEAVRIDKLREAGLPWTPTERTLAAAGITGTGIGETAEENLTNVADLEAERDAARAEADAATAEKDELAKKLADLEARLAEVEQSPPAPADESDAPPAPEGSEPVLPWKGYDDDNADVIKKKLGELNDDVKVTVAENVLAYEQRHGKRSSVVAKANSILDRQPA